MLKAIEIAEEIETIAKQEYEFLAKLFEDDEGAAGLFSALAREEEQHVQRVKLLRSMYVSNRQLSKTDWRGTEIIERLRDSAKERFENLRQSAASLSIKEAKKEMYDLEQLMAAAHAEAIVGLVDEKARHFFEQLAEQDRGHARLLLTQE